MTSRERAARRILPLTGRGAAFLALVVVASTIAPGPAGHAVSAGSRTATTAPNIVLILTDDQRWDSMWAMPQTVSLLGDHGVTFDQSFVVNPVCCPSRTTILTGEWSGATGVWTNTGHHGGFKHFNDGSTIAVWLHNAGYQTALMGKYLNGYTDPHASYIPPGWDQWDAFTSNGGQGNYFNYDLDENGTVTHYGSDASDYSTDVLAGDADQFIRGAEPSRPLFLYLATRAPHQKAVAAPRDKGKFADIPPLRPPNFNEADVSDKPQYIQDLPLLTPAQIAKYDTQYRNNNEALIAVDDLVAKVVTALQDTGRLSNTLIMFASDNGLAYGEHRWEGKWVPYEESIRVPTIIRYDPLTSTPSTDDTHMILNVDWAPTFAALAGVSAPGAQGASLLPILDGTVTSWRSEFLIEHLESVEGIPSYCAVRTDRYIYVKYTDTGEQELYDLQNDPYELQNIVTDPDEASVLSGLQADEKRLCRPPPPKLPASIRDLKPNMNTTEP